MSESKTTSTNKYKAVDVMYGVFDVSMLSLRQSSADNEFRTLAEAFEWIGDELDGNIDEDVRYEVFVCLYDFKRQGWYPAPGASGIQVDARYFTPIEDFIEDGDEE